MKTRTIAAIGIIAVVNVSLFFVLKGYRGSDDSFEREMLKRQGEQGKLLAEWYAQRPVPISSLRPRDSLLKVANKGCLDLPRGAKPVPTDSLSEEVREDLRRATTDLVRAFGEGSCEALVEFMRSRGKVVDPATTRFMKRTLVDELGYDKSELDALEDVNIFAKFWEAAGVDPQWEGIVAESTCLATWHSGSVPVSFIKNNKSLAPNDVSTWGKRGIVNHNFVPENGIDVDDALAHGGVALADFRVIVRHSLEEMHGIAPYYFRFWFDANDDQWKPLLMGRIRISDDVPVRVLF